MAEYSSDEERFSAFVNFFKDHQNTLLIGFLFLASILVSSISTINKKYPLEELLDACKSGGIGKIARENGIFFHVDAAQSTGKIPIDLSSLPVLAETQPKRLLTLHKQQQNLEQIMPL